MGNCFDVLIWQERLKGAYSTQQGYEALDGLARLKLRQGDAVRADGTIPEESEVKQRFALGVLPTLTGSPFYLSKEIIPLIQAGAVSLPMSWHLSPEMMFKNSGFVWFEQSITMETGTIPLVAMGWCPQWASGVVPVTGQEDVPFETDDVLHVVFYGEIPERLPLPITIFTLTTKDSLADLLATLVAVPFNKYATAEKMRLFGAFLSFVNQRILERFAVPLPRQWKRQRARNGANDLDAVQVIRLRSALGSRNPRVGDVEWSYRWVVSGHWRNQFRPSHKDHYPKWIMPYLKGPEDKPLKLSSKTTLFNVNR